MHGGCSVIKSMLIVTAVAIVIECKSCNLGWSPKDGYIKGSRWAQVDTSVSHASAECYPSDLHWKDLEESINC